MPKTSKKDPNKPKGAKTAYNFFLQEQREKLNAEEGKFSLAEFSKASAEKWKSLSEEDKKNFLEKAVEDKKRFDTEMASYTPPPVQPEKKKRAKKPKDPNQPKRNMSAYFHFLNDKRADVKKDNPTASAGDMSKVLGSMWSKMTADEKTPYDELAKTDRQRYELEMKAFKNGETTNEDTKKAQITSEG